LEVAFVLIAERVTAATVLLSLFDAFLEAVIIWNARRFARVSVAEVTAKNAPG
jgi:hypothetical protein